jgi:hypothetical protein
LQFRQVSVPGSSKKDYIHKLAPTGSFDEAGSCQLYQVVGERRRADGKCGPKVGAGRAGPSSYVLENLEAARIGNNPRDGAKLTAG